MRRPLAAVLVALTVVLAGCALVPVDIRPEPRSTVAMTDPPVPTQPELVYFLRDSSTGVRLGRELRDVPQADPLLGVLETMVAGPLDPDYSTGWAPGTRVLSATTRGATTTVDLSAEARTTTLGSEAALAQIDQLLWTVTELAGADSRVALTIGGEPAGELWGVTSWDGPRERDDPLSARARVSIDTPVDGAVVRSPVVVSGDAAAFEATVLWRVTDEGGAVVEEGFTDTSESMTFAPYSFEVALPSGRYTVEVREEDLGDGEGFRPEVDDRRFTVEG